MKTLILLTALVTLATAGPTFLGKDTIDEDSRTNGVLTTIKRERKSPIQESPSELLSNVAENSQALPNGDVRASSTGRNSGFNKPIIVKKKFGYRIYRDSDEELAQGEPRENCRSQFRFKLCDESNDQVATALRTTQTEDIVESDVEQSLRMAKEAVEILQRDLLKIERNTKLAQKKLADEKFEEKLGDAAKEYRQHDERFSENTAEATQGKASALRNDAEMNSDEKKMADWNEVIKNMQNNIGIVRNSEDPSQTKLNNLPFEEEINLNARNTESIDANIAKIGSDLITNNENIETKQGTPKSAEENVVTYATENKDVKVGLLSDSLKIEKAASLETSDIQRNAENEKSLTRDTKQDDVQLNVQGKSSEKLLDSSHHIKLTSINQDELNNDENFAAKLAQNGEFDLKNAARSTSLETIHDKAFESKLEDMKVMRQDENTKKDVEDIQAKAALEENKNVNLKENKMELKDVETLESRNLDSLFSEKGAETPKEIKEKSAMPWIPELVEKSENTMDFQAKSSDSKIELLGDQESLQRNANEKPEDTNLNVPIISTSFEVEQKNMRESGKGDEKLWSVEPTLDKTHEHVDALKLRKPEESDDKVIVNNIVEARNIATTSLEDSHVVTEDKNMRNAFNGEEKQWNVESSLNEAKDPVNMPKLREAEDIDEKLEVNDFVQARNVENEETERLFGSKKHTEEKSALMNSMATFDDALNQELNKEKKILQKSAETENEDKQKLNLKISKNQEHLEHNDNHDNKKDLLKERNSSDVTKSLRFGEPTDLHAHSSHDNVDSERIQNTDNLPSMKMSEMEYYKDIGNQHTSQLIKDKNIDIHASSHLKDTASNWNREKYYHNIHEPYPDRWPHDIMRSHAHLDSNAGDFHMQHHHMGNMHSEGEPHRFLPMGRFHQMEHQYDPLNNPAVTDNIQENGRASEWDIAMEPSMNMDMRHALDKNGMPWGFHRHAGFGSSIPIGGPASGGPGAVGLFPGANAGCGIPLLLSCSPSVVSGSLAKSQSLRFNEPAYRSGDDLRFYTKRDVKTHEDKPAKNAKTYFITTA